jgi:hypothetical protein
MMHRNQKLERRATEVIKNTVRYARYAVSALAAIAFGVSLN